MHKVLCLRTVNSSNYWGLAHYIVIEKNNNYILKYDKKLFEYYHSTKCIAPEFNKFQSLLETNDKDDIIKAAMTLLPSISDVEIKLFDLPFTDKYNWFDSKSIVVLEEYCYRNDQCDIKGLDQL